MSLGPYITLVYGVAGILLILFALLNGDSFFGYSSRDYLLFLLLALVPQLIGHTTVNWALRFFSATLVAVFILGEPILATLLAYFLLGEPVGPRIFLGGTLVLLGIYLMRPGGKEIDGFVKSSSAASRGNPVVAAHL